MTSLQPPLQSPLPSLHSRRIAFTTPSTYSPRLLRLLQLHNTLPLHIPTILVGPTPSILLSLRSFLHSLPSFSALALPSRSSISSLSLSLPASPPLPPSGPPFILSALGSDADLLTSLRLPSSLCPNPDRVRILLPNVPSPAGLAAALGDGSGRRILCLVPDVVGLEEPHVVPDFLRDLRERGWAPERVIAYETRWAGPLCVEGLVAEEREVDAVVFTSTAEVEGLLRGLEAVGWSWQRVRERWPRMVTAAHGPVTAAGAERLGVYVDVVGERFGSFAGVLEALADWWSGTEL